MAAVPHLPKEESTATTHISTHLRLIVLLYGIPRVTCLTLSSIHLDSLVSSMSSVFLWSRARVPCSFPATDTQRDAAPPSLVLASARLKTAPSASSARTTAFPRA
ncbi:hypothetical protein B296_00018173 [Ensete ventricosum]|uniref:Uncharacterized protein n=1 Tax=Ensete ventricosum TaxID=4639 RepID=A0A426YLR0_ENSVE|nr:hypothetical protein B296_00018173 [Ensete ventricosum]